VSDASDKRDLLLVAGIDRTGETIVCETELSRASSRVRLAASREYSSGYETAIFDDVRAVWGIAAPPGRRQLGHGISAEVPEGWTVRQPDRTIDLIPPEGEAGVHISVFRRKTETAPQQGEASGLVERFPVWADGTDRVGPSEEREGDQLVATGSCIDSDGRSRWEIGSRVGSTHAIVYSYNDDGKRDDLRAAARAILASIDAPLGSSPDAERRGWFPRKRT
jgi:hypothetical protein